MPHRRRLIAVLPVLMLLSLLALAPSAARAQGGAEDYRRSAELSRLTRGTVFRDSVDPHWLEDNIRFWYRNDLPDGRQQFILVDAEAGTREPAFDHEALADALNERGVADGDVEADRLPIEDVEVAIDEGELRFRLDDEGAWRYELASGTLAAAEPVEPDAALVQHPDDGPDATARTGANIELTFANRTREQLRLFWLDSSGDRNSYGNLTPGEEHVQNTYAGHVWLIADDGGAAVAVIEAPERSARAVIDELPEREPRQPRARRPQRRAGASPDGRWRAFVRDDNVYLRDLEEDEEFALSEDGTEDHGYGGRVYWAPDSQRFVVVKTDRVEEREVHMVESSPRDQLQPRLRTIDYAKPGDEIDTPKPHLFHVESQRRIVIDDALFPNPWHIRRIRWDDDSSRFTFLYNQRGHQVVRIVGVDGETGEAAAIIDEQSDTFIDWAHKLHTSYLDDSDEIIWLSERDGWNHLYLYDAATGDVKNQITQGEWVVRSVDRVDEERRQIWFRAGGIYPEQDPYHVHYARVDFDGSNLTILTEGDGTHSVEYSPDRRFLIATYSRVDAPPVTELRRADTGSLVCVLEEADWSALLETGWQVPERFVAQGRDGETDIYGVIFRPSNFDPEKQYPVVENIYAGPQGSFVPKRFSAYHGSQGMAELGFIVVQIDGMGTSDRSKAFHDVAHQNLADAGLPDRVRWIKAAAEERPYMDLSRVGIYGVSAGGQSAMRAVLAHNDFYHAAVAASACHDNRMDKIWWNELWMGYPVGDHYEEQSNVTNAHRLEGHLLLIHGELDTNVDPASTMQVVDALIRADKDFEMLIVPGAGHGMGGSYGRRRMQDFFVRHLLGVEPRHEAK